MSISKGHEVKHFVQLGGNAIEGRAPFFYLFLSSTLDRCFCCAWTQMSIIVTLESNLTILIKRF